MKQQGQHNGTDRAVRIGYWWDRLSRNWIFQALDAEDNQIGDAQYAANRGTLPGALSAVQCVQAAPLPAVRI